MQLNVTDYAWITGETPSSPGLYSNDVLMVCVAEEAWECYKNVIVFVTMAEFGGH